MVTHKNKEKAHSLVGGGVGEVALPQEKPTLLYSFDNVDGGPPGPPSRTQSVHHEPQRSLEGAQLAGSAIVRQVSSRRPARSKGGEGPRVDPGGLAPLR